MNEIKSENCPQPTVLVEFLQGRLTPPQLGQCESHLKDCPRCHETLVGLSSEDTLSEKIADALRGRQPQEELPAADDARIGDLFARLTSDQFKQQAIVGGVSFGAADSEMIADRAAEVLRCVEQHDEETLGAIGDYTLLRLIGAGSTSVVFQALDQKLERTVALKVLRPSLGAVARDRFLAEAKSAASIEHVNIVTIFQVGQVGRLAFIAMPWLPGQTLETLLKSQTLIDEHRAIEIVTQVAVGLEAAHQRQLVHRDIKPANLWICDADNQLKILDFGLARIGDDDPGLTATGMLAGTPSFMSPEQTRGQELDGRSDLFSLGCVLYRLLTGKLPFGAPTVLATLQAIQNNQPTPPTELRPDVSQDLSDLTMCLLEKLPADRPSSANQTIELLSSPRERWSVAIPHYGQPALAGVSQSPKVADTSNAGGRWRRWFASGIALMLLGIAGWFWAPQVFRVVTDQGEVVIEATDDDVEVQVLQNGKVIRVVDTKTQQSFDLKSGQYSFKAVTEENAEMNNSFTIAPETLTMKRGETAIVKVSVAQRQANVVKSTGSSSTPKTVSKVYQGKAFNHWLNVVKVELDTKLYDNALKAAAVTRSNEEENRQLLAEMRRQLRQGARGSYRQFHDTLKRFGQDEIFNFLAAEITQGTQNSRGYCGYVISEYKYAASKEVREKLDMLFKLAAKNVAEPGNANVLNALLDSAVAPLERWTKQLLALKAGEKVRSQILNADVESRWPLISLAVAILPDDLEIYRAFESDLLNSKTRFGVRQVIFDRFLSRKPEKLSGRKALTILKCLEDPAIAKSLLTSRRTTPNRISPLEALAPFLNSDTQAQVKSRLIKLEDSLGLKRTNRPSAKGEHASLQRLIGKQKPVQTARVANKATTSTARIAQSVQLLPAVDKPFFKGKTFRQWMQTAKLDRDPKSRTEALVACTATAETDGEWQELMTLTQKLARKYGTDILAGGNAERFHNAFMQVLDNCDLDLVVDFMKQEIENGTEASRKFCYMWIMRVYGGEQSRAAIVRGMERRTALRQRVVELADVIADHLEALGVPKIVTVLIPDGEGAGEIRAQLRQSALGIKLKQRVTEGDVQQRFMLYDLALGLFDDDSDVSERYQKDLVDPALNNIAINNLNGRPAHGTTGRLKLFQALFPYTPPSTDTAGVVNEKRAKLLMKLADGVVAKGDSRLKFSDNSIYLGVGPAQNAAAFSGVETVQVNGLFYPYHHWPRSEAVSMMLSPFHKIGIELSDENQKSMFVPKLLALKQFLTEMSDEELADEARASINRLHGMGGGGMGGVIASSYSRVRKDLDYLIKLFNGDSTAEMAKDSMFQPRTGGVFGGGGGGMF